MVVLLPLLFTSATLVQYLDSRTEISAEERAQWDKALRLTFGGSALRHDDDDAISAARSVIAYGMFHQLDPMKVMRAAYEAKNDSLAFVPPPMAVKYQQLALLGRRPTESARFLAFNFPRYFDEELAPEMVAYWQKLLDTGKASAADIPRIERQLKETRTKMKPGLREISKRAAEIERDVKKGRTPAAQAKESLELARQDLVLALGPKEGAAPFNELFERLSKDLNLPAVLAPEPPPPPPAPVTSPSVKTNPKKNEPKQEPKKNEPKSETETTPAGWELLPTAIQRWIGTPYLLGGVDQKGIDCSGFSREVYRESKQFELPRTSVLQALEGAVVDTSELRAGDLVFFDTLERGRITHVGVYKGGGVIAHATSSRGVTYEKLSSKWLQHAYRGARRLF
ncbi:MAG: C40 family peptidase [Deltaproteobacteria bacterium]|nr:C40 family peptidase [Deltaproteobacteria bacterium]